MAEANDTIVAISTPPGRGGIGIVRLSGPASHAIAQPLLRPRGLLEAGRARFAEVLDADSQAVLDQAVVTYFAAPHSYSGEDVIEIAAHGSPVLLHALLARCVAAGARLAEPGEFTQRAFLSGRIDLTQAEAVHDLIQSTTLQQARTAAQQLGGGLSRKIAAVKRLLIDLIAALEAGIDFAEDDLEVMEAAEIFAKIARIEAPLVEMEKSFAYGRVLREGFRLAIVGRPNAGKSSLFNCLIRSDRAIVTAQPGTTRDPVEEQLDLSGIPVSVVDTAGLRTASDEAEAIGIRKSREVMAGADVVLLVIAANEPLHSEDIQAMESSAGRKLVVAMNKADLLRDAKESPERARSRARTSEAALSAAEYLHTRGEASLVETSATEGSGLEDLRLAILGALQTAAPSADTAPVTNLRQHGAIISALAAIRAARTGSEALMPHEMLLLDLHEALQALDILTGTTHTDDILNLIFASFCIGK